MTRREAAGTGVIVHMHDTTHARHDPAHCLCPGLFRSLLRGERKKKKLDVTYVYGEKETLRFVGFEPLGADDMRLLQVIVALAGPRGLLLTPEPGSTMGRQLRLLLEPGFDALEQDGLVVRESMAKLLSESGITDGGENLKSLKSSLLRLSNVSVLVTQGTRQASFHLLSHAFDEADGRLWIALNPRIAETILGRRPHTRLDMSEIRALKSDPARLIHQRLCGFIDPGATRRVAIDTLCGYAWTDHPSENPNTTKYRRAQARKALAELSALGWTISEYAHLKCAITRPGLRSNATPLP